METFGTTLVRSTRIQFSSDPVLLVRDGELGLYERRYDPVVRFRVEWKDRRRIKWILQYNISLL